MNTARRPNGHLTVRDLFRFLRWSVVAIVLLIGCFAALLGWAGSEEKAWLAAKPAGLSADQWKERRGRCAVARLDRTACAAMQPQAIERLAARKENADREKLCADDASAEPIRQAQTAVTDRLKSPSSVSFVSASTRAVHAGCIWIVSGDLDAQNGFGARIRSAYRVKLLRLSQQTWAASSTYISD